MPRGSHVALASAPRLTPCGDRRRRPRRAARRSPELRPSRTRCTRNRHQTGSLVNRYYDPTTGEFMTVDPDLAETDQPYQYAGGDPMNSSDPTGLGGYGKGGHTNPVTQACHQIYGESEQEMVSACVAAEQSAFQEYGSGLKERLTCDLGSSPIGAGVIIDLPTIDIEGPLSISISSDLKVSGPDSNLGIDIHNDGTLDINAGGSTVSVSPEGALEGLSASVGGVSVSQDGISVTRSTSLSVGDDTIEADITATLEPPKWSPPAGAIPIVVGAGAAVGIGITIWWALKLACPVLGPEPAALVCVYAA